jgi:hypothetical protein
VAYRFDQPELLKVGELLRLLGGQVMRLGPVGGGVVELPHVLGERMWRRHHVPWDAVNRLSRPAAVINAAVAHQLEVLGVMALVGRGVVERVGEGDALHRYLGDAVDRVGLLDPRELENRGGNIDYVVPLTADLAGAVDLGRPVDDRAVARPAIVRGHLLGPLIRGTQGVGPPDGVVVVGVGAAQVVEMLGPELRGFVFGAAVGGRRDHERAVEPALRRRAVCRR